MEARTPLCLGESLLVPCVQELAKQKLTSLPARYVRPDDTPVMCSDAASLPQVPVIDMQKLLAGEDDDDVTNTELEKFHLACKDWGFFQLINHGVSGELVEEVKKNVEKFFKMPMGEKKKLWQKPGDHEGFGQSFVFSEDQKLDWADMFYLITHPTHLRHPQLFPNLPPFVREPLEAYAVELGLLALKLLNTVAKTLKMEVEDMKQLFEEGFQAVRMNYYPPCPEPDKAVGLSSHSDATGLTIFLQLNETEGLQVKRDGMWVPVNPLPDAFVVNIGDILEIVTNGLYRSIEHRATVNSQKERLSIATFFNPNMKGDMGPASSLITSATPALFRRIGVKDFFNGFFARELEGNTYLDLMRI